jgi:hypothetical protein
MTATALCHVTKTPHHLRPDRDAVGTSLTRSPREAVR